jgi:hypothetical protein
VEDELGTLFWWDRWIEGDTLKSRFSRLFDLSNNKLATVTDMYLLGWGREELLGDRGGDCWLGRKNWWVNFVSFYLPLYCRFM